jgi:hypothetical protein
LKKLLVAALILLGTQFVQAQFFKDNFYYEGEIGGIVSFAYTDSEGETHPVTIGGVNFRGGLGIHDEGNNFFFGLHSGMDGTFRHRTGILPVYINSRLALGNDKSKIILAFGYGKSFQMGHENLHGFLRKYTIGYATITERNNMETFFIEINNHGFNFPDDNIPAITLNFGYTFTFL